MEKNNTKESDKMVSIIEYGIENIKIGDEVRWVYQSNNKYTKPSYEVVRVGSLPIGEPSSKRIRIDRVNGKGEIVAGGYINVGELFML